ncbi:MAG: alkaline phosphatase D family protein [Bacteroidota bacterium]
MKIVKHILVLANKNPAFRSALWILFMFIAVTNCSPVLSSVENGVSGPFFATGMKIGEVTSSSAVIWGRLTQDKERVGRPAPIPQVLYKNKSGEWVERKSGRRPNLLPRVEYPDGYDVTNIEGATPGAKGWLKLKYRTKKGAQSWKSTDWVQVDSTTDFTKNTKLEQLSADTYYEVELISSHNGENEGEVITGSFTTAPVADVSKPLVFTATTCTSYDDVDSIGYGYKIYDHMKQLNPSFFVHLGDILYYDDLGKTSDLARWHWDRMYSLPTHIDFHQKVASYFIKDDHDTWMNDSWPGRETQFMGDFTFEEGLKFFLEEVPMDTSTYRTVRWGQDLQIWMVEGRDFRSPNTMPDGPDKTIWGEKQKQWFYETVAASNATFKILFSPTPVVGPDRDRKNDNHSNAGFAYEGKEIRDFLTQQENMFVICGDRHWQYVSEDSETGLKEFSVGPGSDAHAQGWSQDDRRPEHAYLNVVGGFLSGELSYTQGVPKLTLRHHDVNGVVLNQEEIYPLNTRNEQ